MTEHAPSSGPVLAAGGCIWRRSPAGDVEVVLIHRPRYDDWSLPKGKLDPGETDEMAALREVEEETTIVAALGTELSSVTYTDRSGKQKRVRYWAMTVVSGEPGAANEVDDAVWVGVPEAVGRLSYPHDVAVINALLAMLAAPE